MCVGDGPGPLRQRAEESELLDAGQLSPQPVLDGRDAPVRKSGFPRSPVTATDSGYREIDQAATRADSFGQSRGGHVPSTGQRYGPGAPFGHGGRVS